MMSNKKPISPWEKEVKHVSPRTLLIAGLALCALVCFSVAAMNFNQASTDIGDTDGVSSSVTDSRPNDGTGTKGPNADPYYQGHADIGGGMNQPDDGAGNFVPAKPIDEPARPDGDSKNQPEVSAADLEQSGAIPTLKQLQSRKISCVYDADGNQYDLFEEVTDQSPRLVETEIGTFHHGVAPRYRQIEDAKLPEGDLYVDRIASGRYLVYPNPEDGQDDVYILFNSGRVHCTLRVVGGMWLGVYDALITFKDGTAVNTLDEPVNS